MKSILPIAALMGLAAPAAAHVMLSQATAPAGSTYTAYFRVAHGCAGSATTALRIEIPAETTGAKPQPKAGWVLKIEHTPLPAPVKGEGGRTITERVSAVTWTGGPLPDDEWDEFGLSVRLPKRDGALSFPAVQTCEAGSANWTEVPQPGQSAHALAHPAPTVTLSPAADDGMAGMPMGH